jgi:PAS domain S-box-containing protein
MADNTDSAWLYRKIVEDSPIGILYADRQGMIRFWNRGAGLIFGHTAQEAIGQSLDLIVPEKQRPRHWEGWNRVMETGVTKYGNDALAVPAMRKDGTRISIEFNILLLRSEDGQLQGAVAMVQDVTARWQQQKDLRSRLAALEARTAEAGKTG